MLFHQSEEVSSFKATDAYKYSELILHWYDQMKTTIRNKCIINVFQYQRSNWWNGWYSGLQFDLRWPTLEKLEILRICTLPSKSQGVIVIVCQSFQIYQKIKGKNINIKKNRLMSRHFYEHIHDSLQTSLYNKKIRVGYLWCNAQKWMSIKGINSSMSSIFPVVFHKKQSIEEKNIVLN